MWPEGSRCHPKLGGFFEGRPHLTVVPVVGRAEDIETLDAADDLDLLVSASHTVPSRIAVAQLASRHRIPHISAALAEGRLARGGFVTAWTPTAPMLLCAGNADPAVLYLNTELMQNYWSSATAVTQ